MAEEYIIRIQAEGDAQTGESIPVAVPTQGGVSVRTITPPDSGSGVGTQLSRMVVTGALMPAITTLASTAVSTIGLQTGNNKLQQRINIGMSLASKAAGLYGSVSGGMIIGGVPGAIVGAAIFGIQEAASVSGNYMRHQFEYQNENNRLGVLRERAGMATNRRR
ncbi:MAG: hypothetical protein J6S41_04815 [Clostridia bacterium]|nr:hypothetical protein [Clostridia bacterium]